MSDEKARGAIQELQKLLRLIRYNRKISKALAKRSTQLTKLANSLKNI